MLDALIDRQDRDEAGAGQATGVEHLLQRAENARIAVGRCVQAIDEIRPWEMQAVARDGLALVLQERGVSAQNLLNLACPGCRRSTDWSHVSPLTALGYADLRQIIADRRRHPATAVRLCERLPQRSTRGRHGITKLLDAAPAMAVSTIVSIESDRSADSTSAGRAFVAG